MVESCFGECSKRGNPFIKSHIHSMGWHYDGTKEVGFKHYLDSFITQRGKNLKFAYVVHLAISWCSARLRKKRIFQIPFHRYSLPKSRKNLAMNCFKTSSLGCQEFTPSSQSHLLTLPKVFTSTCQVPHSRQADREIAVISSAFPSLPFYVLSRIMYASLSNSTL